MKKITYIIGFFTVTLVSCNKEVIQPNEDVKVVNGIERREGSINNGYNPNDNTGCNNILPSKESSVENPNPEPDDTGGITDPNNDDYSNRKPGKTKK